MYLLCGRYHATCYIQTTSINLQNGSTGMHYYYHCSFIPVICIYRWENGGVEATRLVGRVARVEIQGDSSLQSPATPSPSDQAVSADLSLHW